MVDSWDRGVWRLAILVIFADNGVMTEGTDNRGNDKTLRRIFIWGGIVFLSIYFAFALSILLRWAIPANDDLASVGQFGDSFGVLNAFFSGFALLAVVASLWQGQRQLAMQQKELRKGIAEQQKRAAQDQFFQMLRSWQSVIGEVFYRDKTQPSQEYVGRAALTRISHEIHSLMTATYQTNDDRALIDIRRDWIIASYTTSVAAMDVQIGHYFRMLYHIVRFIDKNKVLTTYSDKQDFIRILRAHFSQAEFVLIFYNCIHPVGRNFKPLVDKYDLLQNMEIHDVAQPIDFDFYPLTKERWIRDGRRIPTNNDPESDSGGDG